MVLGMSSSWNHVTFRGWHLTHGVRETESRPRSSRPQGSEETRLPSAEGPGPAPPHQARALGSLLGEGQEPPSEAKKGHSGQRGQHLRGPEPRAVLLHSAAGGGSVGLRFLGWAGSWRGRRTGGRVLRSEGGCLGSAAVAWPLLFLCLNMRGIMSQWLPRFCRKGSANFSYAQKTC